MNNVFENILEISYIVAAFWTYFCTGHYHVQVETAKLKTIIITFSQPSVNCWKRIKIITACFKSQHDLTPRIYVLHKITIALKFMSCINQKLRPSYKTVLNLCLTQIENFGRKFSWGMSCGLCTRNSGSSGNWRCLNREG